MYEYEWKRKGVVTCNVCRKRARCEGQMAAGSREVAVPGPAGNGRGVLVRCGRKANFRLFARQLMITLMGRAAWRLRARRPVWLVRLAQFNSSWVVRITLYQVFYWYVLSKHPRKRHRTRRRARGQEQDLYFSDSVQS